MKQTTLSLLGITMLAFFVIHQSFSQPTVIVEEYEFHDGNGLNLDPVQCSTPDHYYWVCLPPGESCSAADQTTCNSN